MRKLLEFFDSLKERFDDDDTKVKLIDRQIQFTNEWIDENTSDEPQRSPRRLGKVEAPDKLQSTRSIFDDIDVDDSEG